MLIYLLIGLLLAQRFKVFVLVPALAVTIVLAITLGYHSGYSASEIVIGTIEDVVCLQLGYLVGAGLNHVFMTVFAGVLHHRTIDGPVSHSRTR
jgi:hypothetical protein